MAAVATQEIKADTYVGFETITSQIEHKLLKRGFQFNVILVGERRNAQLRTVQLTQTSVDRPNWAGKKHHDQHYFCQPPH
jgi:septin family protein